MRRPSYADLVDRRLAVLIAAGIAEERALAIASEQAAINIGLVAVLADDSGRTPQETAQ